MLLVSPLLFVSAQFNNLLDSDGNAATNFYIVSTSESRYPNAALFMHHYYQDQGGGSQGGSQPTLESMMSSSRACGALDAGSPCATITINDVDYGNVTEYARNLIIEAPGNPDHYHLVGSYYSPKKGFYAFADARSGDFVSSWIDAIPYKPESPNDKGLWRIIPSGVSTADGVPAYHIVSASSSNKPNEMIYLDGDGIPYIWDYSSTDALALWKISAAPPSPPIDYSSIVDDHAGRRTMDAIMSIVEPALFGAGALAMLLYFGRLYLRKRAAKRAMTNQTQHA